MSYYIKPDPYHYNHIDEKGFKITVYFPGDNANISVAAKLSLEGECAIDVQLFTDKESLSEWINNKSGISVPIDEIEILEQEISQYIPYPVSEMIAFYSILGLEKHRFYYRIMDILNID